MHPGKGFIEFESSLETVQPRIIKFGPRLY